MEMEIVQMDDELIVSHEDQNGSRYQMCISFSIQSSNTTTTTCLTSDNNFFM